MCDATVVLNRGGISAMEGRRNLQVQLNHNRLTYVWGVIRAGVRGPNRIPADGLGRCIRLRMKTDDGRKRFFMCVRVTQTGFTACCSGSAV